MRKTNSTNYLNEQEILMDCPITTFFHLFGGRWKLIIVWHLKEKGKRFSELQLAIPNISDKMLSQQLKELQKIGILQRHVIDTTPVQVSYDLSVKGRSLVPILKQIYDWGIDQRITGEMT